MKAIADLRFILCLSGISLILSACSGGNWLVGKWELDKEKTMAAFAEKSAAGKAVKEEQQNELGQLLGGLLKSVGRGIGDAILDQFANTSVEFTASEMRIVKNGKGKAVAYEIIERPDSDTIIIKLADGTITSVYREGEHIKQALSGEQAVWLYFRRVSEK